MRPPLPQALVDQAHAFERGDLEAAEPRNAATVVLMRPGEPGSGQGPEVYLLRRQTSMAFAAGMCVFPGGGVDPRDFDATISWSGPSPAAWAARLGVPEDLAGALVCAAVRETFEESGVLLAGPTDGAGSRTGDTGDVVADTTGESWEADRRALEAKELSFTDFLTRRSLVLRTDLLGAWSGWLTPIFEPRRYRTWFFVAVLPAGQITRDVSTESSSVIWASALASAGQVEDGELAMLPPTYLTCLEVGEYAAPGDVLLAAQGRSVEMFMPEVVSPESAAGEAEEFVLSMPPAAELLLERRRGRVAEESP